MEVEEPATGSRIVLAHDKSEDTLLSVIRTLKCQEAEIGNVETTTTHTLIPPSTATGKALRYSEKPPSMTDAVTDDFTLGINASHESFDRALKYQVPTYPAIPPLQSSNATNGTHRACSLSMSRSKRLPRSSAMHLTTVVEHKPPAYAPARIVEKCSVETFDVFEIDDIAEEKEPITGFLSVPTQERGSRTSTMSSVVSEISHQGPGAIYIRPSAQLQNMQSVSDRDRTLQEAARFYNSAMRKTSSRGIYTPTGTPESISNIPLSASVYQAHAKLNRSIRSIPDVGSCRSMQNWAKSSEWVEPCQTTEGPTDWIEDFLTRKEQADRAEEEKTRNEKKEKGALMRGNSFGKFRRRLSKKRVPEERRNTVPRRGRSEVANIPEWTRAFSWDIRTHEDMLRRDVSSDEISPDSIPSPPPFSHVEKAPRKSPPLAPYQPPASHAPEHIAQSPQKYNASQLSLHTPKYTCHNRSSKNSGLPKLKFRSVSLIGTDVKHSFSTTVVPIFVEGRNSISELVGKMEKLGQDFTRGRIGRKFRFKRKGKEGKRREGASVRR